MSAKINKVSLAVAAKKLASLRVEDVLGDKSRAAETVKSCLNRAFFDLGSQEGIEYILRHGLKYYLEAEAGRALPTPPKAEGRE